MMAVEFNSETLTVYGQALSYDPYYFAIAAEYNYTGTEWDGVVKDVLRQWAEGLLGMADGGTLYLPFGIYDQCLQCMEADLIGEAVALRCVWLDIGGYSLNLPDLSEFMGGRHKVNKASPKSLGSFPRVELVAGLRKAKLIPGEPKL